MGSPRTEAFAIQEGHSPAKRALRPNELAPVRGAHRRSAAASLCLIACLGAAMTLSQAGCAGKAGSGKKTIVVTYSILGSLVKELVDDRFRTVVSIPDGVDPRGWEASTADLATIDKADLVVENGLGLEKGMQRALDQARKGGVKFFTASDHVLVRTVGMGEGIPSGDPDQARGAQDPHLWTDPVTMQAVVDALAEEIDADFHVDLSKRRADLDARLEALDAEIADRVAKIPEERRTLLTGHNSIGYFAQRYGFKLLGEASPNDSARAESSAAGLVRLEKLIALDRVSVIFTEIGENPQVAETLAKEARVGSVPLATHSLPKGGGYFEFARGLADTIAEALSR